MSLKDYEWNHIYESHTGEDNYHLVNEFYVPALQNSVYYDRITGFFSTAILNVASRGIEELFEGDGRMRLITGVLEERDKEVLEDALLEDLDEPITETEEARFSLIADLLDQGRLEIKVAEPKSGNWGMFHPKLGIFTDENGRKMAFEGSINETRGAWLHNYERFKVHRSWEEGEEKYVETDEDTFEDLWGDEHPHVDVYELPEAIEEEIVDWKPSDEQERESHVETLREKTEEETEPVTESDKIQILRDGGLAPGGVHIAEESSTITPWPHQRVVSDTAVNTYPNGFVFADEVGLGKTIETGLTLSRLMNSGEIQNGLILPPAGLVQQWQEELWEKFNINVYRYERGTGNRLTFTDALGNEYDAPNSSQVPDEDWADSPIWRFVHEQDGPTVILMSVHTGLRKNHWDKLMPSEGRTRDGYPATVRGNSAENREGVWDTVVVDESHHAREGTNLLELLENLREHTHCYYLLTATPIQVRTEELFHLLSLLDIPEDWRDEDNFIQFFETMRILEDVLDNVEADEGVGQSKLSGEYQSTLNPDTVSKAILTELSQELDLKGGEEQAKQRILTACRLARSYGETYDDYTEKLRKKIKTEVPIGEEKLVEELLQTDEEVFGVVSKEDRVKAIDGLEMDGWGLLPEVFSWATPVNAHLFRNTKDTLRKYEKIGLLKENIPDRNAESKTIPLEEETEELYNNIEEYISKFYKESMKMEGGEAQAIGFVMTTYRQRLTSSIYAISQSLSRRLETLKEKQKAIELGQRREEKDDRTQAVLRSLTGSTDETDIAGLEDGGEDEFGIDIATELVTGDSDEGLKILESEIEELESFIQEIKLVQNEPKINELYDDIGQLHDDGFDRIIVFTQYKDTMNAIRDELVGDFETQVASYSSNGGEMYDPSTGEWNVVSKERVKRSFREDGEVQILVATDSASEGLNLQECGALINFDLPWNPMKVEQRIGRIDRIGQEHDPVKVINYFYEDTVETKIYDRLGDRINDFEEIVGNLQPILSGVEGSIQQITLDEGVSRQSSSTDIDQALNEFESEIEEKEKEMEEQTVEMKESLEDTEPISEEVVMREARLDAWRSSAHPDIGNPSDKTYPYESPFTNESVEKVFSRSRVLRNEDVVFEPAAEIEKEVSVDDSDLEDMYLVTVPDYHGGENLMTEREDTVAYELAPESDTFVVTFDPDCADRFPSVKYLMPGEPLFEGIIEEMVNSERRTGSLDKQLVGDTNEETCVTLNDEPYVVCGWSQEDMVRLDEDGELSEAGYRMDELPDWCSKFKQTR